MMNNINIIGLLILIVVLTSGCFSSTNENSIKETPIRENIVIKSDYEQIILSNSEIQNALGSGWSIENMRLPTDAKLYSIRLFKNDDIHGSINIRSYTSINGASGYYSFIQNIDPETKEYISIGDKGLIYPENSNGIKTIVCLSIKNNIAVEVSITDLNDKHLSNNVDMETALVVNLANQQEAKISRILDTLD